MTYPKKVKLFNPWAKAMVAGATVGQPDYGSSNGGKMKTAMRKRRSKRKRRRKKKKD